MNIKNIHIGSLIRTKVEEHQISIERISRFLNEPEDHVEMMYQAKSIDTDMLMKWCKLLKFDFFRFYTGHLILYSPQSRIDHVFKEKGSTIVFRKSIYTQEVKNFILEKIEMGAMTAHDVVERYKIPKTTLYKWMKKL
ncbi:transposase [Chryseobacterium sp. D764]|uniref:transposase n=1 Tax=unclassified Chryseobacterium TaxID=2593645 RepID=UPI0009841D54|nr:MULTISPECIES: transposase [unclassified Chryseobacterium]QXU48298.1 transposase [Chryseobacterium sp. D764]CAD0222878.1 transposase [Chryseobacterium sp. JV274]